MCVVWFGNDYYFYTSFFGSAQCIPGVRLPASVTPPSPRSRFPPSVASCVAFRGRKNSVKDFSLLFFLSFSRPVQSACFLLGDFFLPGRVLFFFRFSIVLFASFLFLFLRCARESVVVVVLLF